MKSLAFALLLSIGICDAAIRDNLDPEPKITWKHAVGEGLAGPAIAAGSCIVFHRVGNLATVDALDAKTGEPQWKFTYPTDYQDDFGFDAGPRAVPTVSGDRVYTYGAEGMLHCLDLKTGAKIWAIDTTELGSAKGFFGRASAPIIYNDTLFIQLDGIFGLDAKTGKQKWKATEEEAGYSSPTLIKINQKTYSLHLTREGLVCLDPDDGSVIIQEKFRSKMNASVNAATPIFKDGLVFLSACYDVGAALWELDVTNQSKKEIWARGGVLDAHYATPALLNGKLFGFHGRQETGQELRCVDLGNGEVHWSEKMSSGSVIPAGDKLIVVTEKGELILVAASKDKFSAIARGQILAATTRALPTLADGFLYARDGKSLVCVDLRKD